ncbi:MAG: hypothetical protein KAU21_14340 [Gammaproteobacteria bacterium]|nr:hypothetical protein [Gammaproteobacteria bacterium]
MNPGEIVQTNLYARKNYLGRKLKVVQIQEDIEIGGGMVTGYIVLKDGTVTDKIAEVPRSKIIKNG